VKHHVSTVAKDVQVYGRETPAQPASAIEPVNHHAVSHGTIDKRGSGAIHRTENETGLGRRCRFSPRPRWKRFPSSPKAVQG
jgi:hypothetical protein